MMMRMCAAALITVAAMAPAKSEEAKAGPWSLAGLSVYKLPVGTAARLFIQVEGDTAIQVATATVIADRLMRGARLNFVRVFVARSVSGCPIKTILDHDRRTVMAGPEWKVIDETGNYREVPDPSSILRSPGFLDVMTEYARVCNVGTNCEYGVTAC
jgi:hypothetical protein